MHGTSHTACAIERSLYEAFTDHQQSDTILRAYVASCLCRCDCRICAIRTVCRDPAERDRCMHQIICNNRERAGRRAG
jgi:hypothetical protein